MQCADTGCGEDICAHGCLRSHQLLVRNLVYHTIRSPNDVDDLVQETLIRAFQSMHAFRGGSFRAYLARIARNLCLDWLRRKKAKRAPTYVELLSDAWAAADGGPEDVVLQKEFAQELLVALEELGQLDREILLLRHVHRFSYEEIGSVVGMNPGAVRTRVSRARHKVMARLERRGLCGSSDLG
jgi:RNA polymerase sigma factor (sigma-70 family)